jgi:ABC-2 type transport system permease protein
VSPASVSIVVEVARRTWRKTWRRPVALTFSVAQPMMWMLFFGFLLHRYPLDALPAGVTYPSFLAPGIAAMTLLFGASQSGVALIRDLQTGFLERMLRTPAPRWAILAGKVGADVARLLGQAAVVLALGVLVGARVVVAPLPLLGAVGALALFATGFCCLSCIIALRARAPETMASFVHLVNMPLFFTSTALAPAKQMPPWLAVIARWNPLTLVVDALREALLFGRGPEGPLGLFALAALALALGALAAREMRRFGGE